MMTMPPEMEAAGPLLWLTNLPIYLSFQTA
jgi:hypothetical protein